jgi:hypothetical protein
VLPKNITVLACLSLALIAASAPSASAAPGTYTVEVCTQASATGGGTPTRLPSGIEGSGLLYESQNPGGLKLEQCNGGQVALVSPLGLAVPEGGSQVWELVAPQGTRIETLFMRQDLRHQFLMGVRPAFLDWFFAAGPVTIDGWREEGQATPFPESKGSETIRSRFASSGMFCRQEGGGNCGLGAFSVTASDIRAEVVDEFAPGVSGPDLATRTLRGTAEVGFKAVDKGAVTPKEGSGIAKVELVELVGDQKVTLASMSDDNGGKCTTPYKYMQPCKLEIESSFPLDTTKLAEGQHQLAILATDASGLTRETPPVAVLVHNAPSSTARPRINGAPQLGSKLTASPGEWGGAPTSFAFRWYRCPPSVQGDEGVNACGAIAGASGPAYVPGRADLGQRDLVEVKATNGFGSETRLSFPTDVISAAAPAPVHGPSKPLLSHVKLSRKRFRVGGALSKKGKRAAVLAFTCNRAGEVSIAIRRRRRHGKPKSLGRLVAPVKAGRSRILISGKIGKRRLKPGPYEALVRVTDHRGTTSDPARVRFLILPG